MRHTGVRLHVLRHTHRLRRTRMRWWTVGGAISPDTNQYVRGKWTARSCCPHPTIDLMPPGRVRAHLNLQFVPAVINARDGQFIKHNQLYSKPGQSQIKHQLKASQHFNKARRMSCAASLVGSMHLRKDRSSMYTTKHVTAIGKMSEGGSGS